MDLGWQLNITGHQHRIDIVPAKDCCSVGYNEQIFFFKKKNN